MEEEFVEVEETPEVNDIEERAKLLGWQPEGEFKGDPSRHTTAEEWVERSETLVPIMKATNRKLETDLKEALKKQEEMATQFEEGKKTTEKILKMQEIAQERAYEKALDDIKKQQIEAVRDSDTTKFQELEAQKDKLEKPVVEVETPVVEKKEDAPQLTPDAQKFLDEHKEVFESDPDMFKQAILLEQRLKKENPYAEFDAVFYGKLKNKMSLLFPDHPSFKKVEPDGGVDSGSFRSGVSTTSSNKKGFNQLPKEAQAFCDKAVSQGLFKDREEYCSLYDWD